MTIRIITPPAAYACTLAEAKPWCRIDSDDTSQDAVLNLLIAMATSAAEDITGRAFVQRQYELNLEAFERVIELPFPPLISVDQVAYTDIDGNTQIVDPSIYEIDLVREPGRLQPKWLKFWPVLANLGYTFNPVRVTYTAGYVAPGSPQNLADNSYLPPDLRTWIAARISTLFENRSQFVIDSRITGVPVPRDFVDGLLDGLTIGTRFF